MQLAQTKQVEMYGLNYKDQRADALRWLEIFGNPYVASVSDMDGRVGIDWGVYGVPETFVIDRGGVIRYKHIDLSRRPISTRSCCPRCANCRGHNDGFFTAKMPGTTRTVMNRFETALSYPLSLREKGLARKMQHMLCTVAVILLCAGTAQPTTAAMLDGIDLPEQYEGRYKKLIDELRCLVCQNETLADSMPSWPSICVARSARRWSRARATKR